MGTLPIAELVSAALAPLPIPPLAKTLLTILASSLGRALESGADQREIERRVQMMAARLARIEATKRALDWRKK